jgi:hypothetical protein
LVVAVTVQDKGAVGILSERLKAAFESPIDLADRDVRMWVTLSSLDAHEGEAAEVLLGRLEQIARRETPRTSTAWPLNSESR